MRPVPAVLLGVSLLLNAWLLSDRGREEPVRPAPASLGAPVRVSKSANGVDVSGLDPELVRNLGAGEAGALRDFLTACGMEPRGIRSLVAAAISHRFLGEKIEAVQKARGLGWWKPEPGWWSVEGRADIDAREQAELQRVAGDLPKVEFPWQVERWNFLGAGKRKALEQLDRDYRELQDKLPPQPWLPQEAEMSLRLEREKRLDLEALLSAVELKEYDFRKDAETFARDLDRYGVSDAEVRVLYRLSEERDAVLKDVERRYSKQNEATDPFAPFADGSPEAQVERAGIDADYERRKKEILGAERMARGDRDADETFRGILQVAGKFGLDRTRAESVFAEIERACDRVERSEGGASDVVKAEERAVVLRVIENEMPAEARSLIWTQLGWRHYWLKPKD